MVTPAGSVRGAAVLFDISEKSWLRRYARTRAVSSALRAMVADWMANRRTDARFRRFARHFDLIEHVALRMLDLLDEDLATPREPYSAGYEHCALTESRIATVRSLFRWYADKYDQRLAPATGGVLRAADEVALSCWQEAFLTTTHTPPSGPLCYLRSRSRVDNLRRCWIPRDFSVATDDPLAPFLAELPVPVIGLPESVIGEPWWLTVAAHETGHLVQADLGLDDPTRDALVKAVPGPLGSSWSEWHAEVFADTFSTLMVGEAAVWAVLEAQPGPAAKLVAPATGYPPAVVRAVLLGELSGRLGGKVDVPGWAETAEWLSDMASPEARNAAKLVATVPAVAEAALDITVGDRSMRDLADTALVTGSRRRDDWAYLLARHDPVFGLTKSRSAVRTLLAAGVASYQLADVETDLDTLRTNLVAALAAAGAPGLLADPGEVLVETVADRLVELLFIDGTDQ